MKKSLLLIPALMIGASVNAQITITQADLITIGKTIHQAGDTVISNTIGSAGAGKTWNFSSLNADTRDTIDIVAPSATPYASSFPGSNLAGASHGSSGDAYFFVNLSASSFQVDGYAITGSVIDFSPNETVTTLSATYGTTFSNTFGFQTDIPFTDFPPYDSIRIKNTTVKNSVYDAYGSLTIPMGTYNTIRLAETEYTTDSIFIHSPGPFPPAGWSFAQESKDTNYNFSWYANNVGYALLEVDSSRTGEKEARFLVSEPLSVSAAAQAAKSSVYPNPANGMINFVYEGTSNDMLVLFDVTGNMIRKEAILNGTNRIDIAELAAGMYFYNVTGANGMVTSSGKFTVTR